MKTRGAAFLIPSLLVFSISGCSSKTETIKATKIAVFADNQITVGTSGGATAYSMPFLRNHLKLCKEQNVDVIMISGDLVNNAVAGYYQNVFEQFEDVYGTDESKYPEIVCTMGNHEWYTNESSEKLDHTAVETFMEYARIYTSSLRAKSTFNIAEQTSGIGTDYYKVINGIPFVSISGSNSSGMLTYPEEKELKQWFTDISEMDTVKNGCPIFVSYHYAIKDLTYTFGQGSTSNSESLDNILKKYPQVIVFSGDTHFPGANERTINQVDYTDINIGSSCYSRHTNRSGTMKSTECYYNIDNAGSGKDTLVGDVAVDYNRTPHIHIVEVDEKGNTTINRYFSNENPANPKHLSIEWKIPSGVKKSDFVYTNARFKDKSWANKMYGKDGLKWEDSSTCEYSYGGGTLDVSFPDVTDYNYCEHYRVSVTADKTKDFDFVSHYYKWEDQAHEYNFEILEKDLPDGEIKEVKVTAYDFFDNPSINNLIAKGLSI